MSTAGHYKIVAEEEKIPIIWPVRVQTLIADYLKAGKQVNKNINLHYEIETIDLHEKIFEDRLRQKPESLKIMVTAIYRVKRTNSNDEYFYYAATKTCRNAL